MEKLNVINSQIGLSPANAAPTAIPAKPISVIGVSMTLLSPYFFQSPLKCNNTFRLVINYKIVVDYNIVKFS